jgi:hypothetical protein
MLGAFPLLLLAMDSIVSLTLDGRSRDDYLCLPVRNLAVPASMVGSGWPRWNYSQIEAVLCHLGAATPARGMLTGEPLVDPPLEPGNLIQGVSAHPEQGGQGCERDAKGMIDWRRRGARAINQARGTQSRNLTSYSASSVRVSKTCDLGLC